MPNGEACPTFRLGIQNPVSHLINRGRREMSVERALQTVFILIFSARSCPFNLVKKYVHREPASVLLGILAGYCFDLSLKF